MTGSILKTLNFRHIIYSRNGSDGDTTLNKYWEQ